MSESKEAEGRIKLIYDLQSFPSGFTKREFVLTTDEQYPQHLKFETIKDKTALLDHINEGQRVKVAYDVRGNESKSKYYVNLNCWMIKPLDGAQTPATQQSNRHKADGHPMPPAASQGVTVKDVDTGTQDETDQIPF